jgi:hypothetical protein
MVFPPHTTGILRVELERVHPGQRGAEWLPEMAMVEPRSQRHRVGARPSAGDPPPYGEISVPGLAHTSSHFSVGFLKWLRQALKDFSRRPVFSTSKVMNYRRISLPYLTLCLCAPCSIMSPRNRSLTDRYPEVPPTSAEALQLSSTRLLALVLYANLLFVGYQNDT